MQRGKLFFRRQQRRVMARLFGIALSLLQSSDHMQRWVVRLMRYFASANTNASLAAQWVESYFAPGKVGATLLKRLLVNTHPAQRRKFLSQLIVSLIWHDTEAKHTMPNGRKVYAPALMLISPTMRCPLRCKGCYAGNYSREDDLPKDVVWRVIEEARSLGTHFFVILGGEPMAWEHLEETAARFPDCAFQFYTSGYNLDREAARRIVKLGNLFPCVSLEGFESETNWRRGRDGYDRAMNAMDALRAEKALFGFSVTVTHRNVHEVTSDAFANLMIEKGAALGWYFLYMPVGFHPDLSMMPSPQDRNALRLGIQRMRNTKPLLVADFWGDGPLSEGCLAGGRRYLHINNYGDVEPCIFFHFATHNVKSCSLKEALASDLFQTMQRAAPWGRNLLLPCPIIDHPQVLRGLVRKHGAYGTHPGADSIYADPKLVGHLEQYSQKMTRMYDPIFAREYRWAAQLHNNQRYDWVKHPPKSLKDRANPDGEALERQALDLAS